MKQVATLLCVFLVVKGLTQPSVLSDGVWYKLGITQTGVYKIDPTFLRGIGVDPSGINPRTLRIFGNNIGGMLPQPNSDSRPIDLIENAVYVEGESDGRFDDGDYLIFYGVSPHHVEFDTARKRLVFDPNVYSDTAHFFLNFGTENGKRVSTKEAVTTSSATFNTFVHYEILNQEKATVMREGRHWYGDVFSAFTELYREYTFDFKDLVGGEVDLQVDLIAANDLPTTIKLTVDGNPAADVNIRARNRRDPYSPRAHFGSDFGTYSASENPTIGIEIIDPNNGRAYLDDLIISGERELNFDGTSLLFRHWSSKSFPTYTYAISSTSSNEIAWDITNANTPQRLLLQNSGSALTFNDASDDVLRQYVIFSPVNVSSPYVIGRIANQNIRESTTPDALIVTATPFINQAEALAELHRQIDGYDVLVAEVGEIYNEFSSGTQDVSAIRDFIRHLYLKDSDKLKYVLMFGDCSFDYKNRGTINSNFVPVYESRESLDPVESFSSEDYFGFMEEDEGEWIESYLGDHTMDLGVGRIPVNSVKEAEIAVNKVRNYLTSNNTVGQWRKRICFVADDGDGNIHQRDADTLSRRVEAKHPDFDIQKIYLDSYEQLTQANGAETSNQTTNEILEAIGQGVLVLNYLGHGNERVWTDERVFTLDMVGDLTNGSKLPLFITATCQFGRYDDPQRVSGAEKLFFNENGGAIALLTTSRPVYSSTNMQLNEAFYETSLIKSGGLFKPLGDIIKDTKNGSLAGVNNRNFTLMGDPMLRLLAPNANINVLASSVEDTVKALELSVLNGEITDFNGVRIEGFNGTVFATIYDKVDYVYTNGTEQSNPMRYGVRNSVLYRGEVSVNQGLFEVQFPVPKMIDYKLGSGKASFYAYDPDLGVDASGSNIEIVIGGSSNELSPDEKGPSIDYSWNYHGYRGDVGPNPLLIFNLEDENGISLVSNGFRQENQMSIDGGPVIFLNDFYVSELDDYTSGIIRYPLSSLSPGSHTVEIKAWDTRNNLTTRKFELMVSDENTLFIGNLKNYPNPAKKVDGTTVTFVHDRENENLKVFLELLDYQGNRVFRHEYNIQEAQRVINLTVGESDLKGVIPGVYFYKIDVTSGKDNAQNLAYQRLMLTD